jgi:hypothetical protein
MRGRGLHNNHLHILFILFVGLAWSLHLPSLIPTTKQPYPVYSTSECKKSIQQECASQFKNKEKMICPSMSGFLSVDSYRYRLPKLSSLSWVACEPSQLQSADCQSSALCPWWRQHQPKIYRQQVTRSAGRSVVSSNDKRLAIDASLLQPCCQHRNRKSPCAAEQARSDPLWQPQIFLRVRPSALRHSQKFHCRKKDIK